MAGSGRQTSLWLSSIWVIWPTATSVMQVEQVATTGYKWLRAVAKGEFTGLHCDKVFLGRGSQRLLTAWLPLSQVGQLCDSTDRSRVWPEVPPRAHQPRAKWRFFGCGLQHASLHHASLPASCSSSSVARLLSVWLAVMTATGSLQVAVEDGSMMVCAGSHRMRSFAKLRDGYGGSQVSLGFEACAAAHPEGP